MIRCDDIKEQAIELAEPIFDRWREILFNGDFVLGKEVQAFEAWMSRLCNNACAISVNSGTDALTIALQALGVGHGHEVVTCSNTFIASVGAIVAVGAKPVLADVGSDELMSIKTIEPLLNERTKAVLIVYLRGRSLDIKPIVAVCRSRAIAVIEDCAQAIGTKLNGVQVGVEGDASAFSFHPLKSLGGFGDGGVLVTRNAIVADYAKAVRNHGSISRDEFRMFGINSRLDTLQAAVLNVKAQYLDQWLSRRMEIAEFYNQALIDSSTGIDLGGGNSAGNSYFHYVVKSNCRALLQSHLLDSGVLTAIHYPTPIHLQKAWIDKRGKVSLPFTEVLANEILTIPCHPHLSDTDVERVVLAIKSFDKRKFRVPI